MPALLQFKRTKKQLDDDAVKAVSLRFGEPFYIQNNAADSSDVSIVVGDGKDTPIENLPKFTPTPKPTETVNQFNNVYYYVDPETGKSYLIDKNGEKLSVIGSAGSATVSTYTGTLGKDNWKQYTDEGGVKKEYYYQDVSLPELQEKNPATIDVLLKSMDNYSQILSNWKYVLKAETYDGGIRFFAVKSDISCDLPFQAQTVNDLSEILVQTTATIGTDWIKSTGGDYYTQTVTIEDISSINNSMIDLIVDLDNYATQLKEWGKIIKIDTNNNVITIYARQETTIKLPIQLYVYTMTSK